jgi:hypothetical protein
MAKVVVLICDICRQRTDVVHPVKEVCHACREGDLVDLRNITFPEWPRLVSKESVKLVLALRDEEIVLLKKRNKDAAREVKKLNAEIARLKRMAADGKTAPNMERVLDDITSQARR